MKNATSAEYLHGGGTARNQVIIHGISGRYIANQEPLITN